VVAMSALLAMGIMALVPAAHANSILVQANPSHVSPGGTVTLTLNYGAGAPGESETVTQISVCNPGTNTSPCPSGSTQWNFLGGMPTFSCTSGDLCTGTYTITFPSQSGNGVCTITSGAGTGTCSISGTCSAPCWTSGANTNSGNYGVLVLYTSSIATGTFSADNGFSTPQFAASLFLVASVAVVGVALLKRRGIGLASLSAA